MSISRSIMAVMSVTSFILIALVVPIQTVSNVSGILPDGSLDYLMVDVDNDWRIWGDIESDTFGATVVSGDLDGDGMDDLAVGVPFSTYGKGGGAVLLFFARDRDELQPAEGFTDADVIITGLDKDDRFGTEIAIIDMNEDGRDEMIIGAPYGDGIGNAKRDCGEVYIITGRSRQAYGHITPVDALTNWGHIIGRDAGDHQGSRIRIGDLDADGDLDYILGCDGSGGTANSAPEEVGGSPWGENGVLQSWEIDVIEGGEEPLGTWDIGRKGSLVRYYAGHLRDGIDIPTRIGNGIALADFDGDGMEDLLFSYRFDAKGWITMSRGGPNFPYVAANSSYVFPDPGASTNNPHPLFYPNMTIDLGQGGYAESRLLRTNADGDDHDDILVGMTGASGWDAYRTSAGQVDLFLGTDIASAPSSHSDAIWTLYGEDAGDRMGSYMLSLDREGDGTDEFFLASPYTDGPQNRHDGSGEMFGFFFDGSFPANSNVTDADLKISGRAGYNSFKSMTSMDMDGNSYPELVTSSPGATAPDGSGKGLVAVMGLATSYDALFYTEGNAWNYGANTIVRDLDRDGYQDLIVSAHTGNNVSRGLVDVYFGRAETWSGRYLDTEKADITYEADNAIVKPNRYFGMRLACGDVDDDGYDDVLIMIESDSSGVGGTPGCIYIFWGGTKAQMAAKSHHKINGYGNFFFGKAIAFGDVNGDGVDDLAISAPDADSGPSSERAKGGRVHLWYGPLSRATMSATGSPVTVHGAVYKDYIGESLAIADLDGDGYGEIVIGAPSASPGTITQQGAVYVIKGDASLPSSIDLATDPALRIDGEWPYDGVGVSLETGDIDGDGKEELMIGAPQSDGFIRRVSNAGNVYILTGEQVSAVLPQGVIRLRQDATTIIHGSQEGESFGRSMCLADIDGDSKLELAIGSPYWLDTSSGLRGGAVSIVTSLEQVIDERTNSSEIPKLLGIDSDGRFGYSIDAGFMDGDARADLMIGTPNLDTNEDGSAQGGVFLWISKSLLSRDIKALPLTILNPDIPSSGGTRRSGGWISPYEGPYTFRVDAWTTGGVDNITEVGLTLVRLMEGQELRISYHPGNGSFVERSGPIFKGRYMLDRTNCTVATVGGLTITMDLSIVPRWGMPDPDMIVTYIRTTEGDHYNYQISDLHIDDDVSVSTANVLVEPVDGEIPLWLNSTTSFSVVNVTLVHTNTGRQLSRMALETLDVDLLRPDGKLLGTSGRDGTLLHFDPVVPGENLTGKDLPFRISVREPGLVNWTDQVVPINVDTYAPSAIETFVVYPDGTEAGEVWVDDDSRVQVFWDDIRDNGDSGVSIYRIHMVSGDGTAHTMDDTVSSGDILLIPEGLVRIGLQAIDMARNEGQIFYREVVSDLNEPIFRSETPVEGSWLKEGSMTLTVEVFDGGSGLDLSSARFRYYDVEKDLLSTWLNPAVLLDEGRVVLRYEMPPVEGILNYVQWSIADLSGREAVSRPISYNVDLTLPIIQTKGSQVQWVNGDPLNLSCEMKDLLSGLELSSVSYRFGPQAGFQGMPWTSMGYQGFAAAVYPNVIITPDLSGYAYMQWRALDKAGNYAESDLEVYYVDRTLPALQTISPDPAFIIGKERIVLSAMILETESGIPGSGVEFSLSRISDWIRYGVGGYSPWTVVDSIVDTGAGYFEASVDITLDDGDFNFIRLRFRDIAGNGWVETPPYRLQVSLRRDDLPPVARFLMQPYVDSLYQGETVNLNASSSYDPEGKPLTFAWYSDLEFYPMQPALGNRSDLDLTLNTTGVHRIWLEVSDGTSTVRSESAIIRVQPIRQTEEEASSGEETSMEEILPYLILALVLGALIGAFLVLVLKKKREQETAPLPPPVLVDAEVETEWHAPHCPYCDAEVRTTDEYCIKCGTVFNAEDLAKIKAGGEVPKKKKDRLELQRPSEENILPPTLEAEPMFLAEDGEGEPPGEMEELETLEELEELEEFEDEEEDVWGVEP